MQTPHPRLHLKRWLLLTLLAVNVGVFAAEPLHVQVDQLLAAKAAGKTFAAPATDAEFVRRAYLDFNGTIPTAEQARAFLADKAADKRAKLIEQLLASPKFPERMAEAFNIQLMERNGSSECIARKRVPVIERHLAEVGAEESLVDASRSDGRSQSEVPAREAFPDAHDVGTDSALFGREQRASSSESSGDFIGNK